MDSALTKELREKLGSLSSIHELNQEGAISLLNEIATQYVADRACVWWWDGLLEKPVVVDYGEDLGWDRIVKLVRPTKSQQVYLVATDDDPEPWAVYKGNLLDLVSLLEDMWRFEYIIVDVELSWLIFDTHHNSLVVAGTLKDHVEEVSAT